MALLWHDMFAALEPLGSGTQINGLQSIFNSLGMTTPGASDIGRIYFPGLAGLGALIHQDSNTGQNWYNNVTSGFFGIRLSAISAGDFALNFSDIAASVINFYVNFVPSTGIITIYDASVTLRGTSQPNSFPASAPFYLQVGFTIGSGTSGAITVKDGSGNTLVSASGINTQAGSNAYINGWQCPSGGGFSNPFQYSDQYLCDATGSAPNNTYLGAIVTQAQIPPAGTGHVDQFTPSGAATNYQAMDNLTGATYAGSSTVGQASLVTLPALSGSTTKVFGFTGFVAGEITGSGSRSVTAELYDGTNTDSTDTSTSLTTAIIVSTQTVHQTELDGSTALTTTYMNNLQVGPLVTA